MREISLTSADWDDLDEDEDSGGLSLVGLDPTPEEIAALMDAVGDEDEDEWRDAQALDAELGGLDAEQLAAWAEDQAGDEAELSYPADMAPGTPFARWMDAKSPAEFAHLRDVGRAYAGQPDGELGWLREQRQIDNLLANASGREAVRQAQDQDEQARRTGPRHRRPTDEVCLSNALDRYGRGTYLYGQLDMANDWSGGDPFAGEQFGASAASPADAMAEVYYQIEGGIAPARSRRQPLPPVGRLAKRIGLVQ